jgi:hypothetical protein
MKAVPMPAVQCTVLDTTRSTGPGGSIPYSFTQLPLLRSGARRLGAVPEGRRRAREGH